MTSEGKSNSGRYCPIKLLRETLPRVSRSTRLRSCPAAFISSSRGQRSGLPLWVTITGRRSTWRTA